MWDVVVIITLKIFLQMHLQGQQSGQFNNLFGSKRSFFELSLGYRYIDFSKHYPTNWISAYFPVISIGYRYQKQINKLGSVFRIYGGTDGVGISFGLGF
jgi:hypothetical protein